MSETTKIENSKVKTPDDVPYIVFESAQANHERQIKRLWIALIVAIVAIFATNGIWLLYINQYDFESYSVSTEGGGNANFIGNDGDIYNGTSESSEENQKEP